MTRSAPVAKERGSVAQPAPQTFQAATALAALSGLLYFLAFPGVGYWPLGAVAWVPLLFALRGQSARRGATLGWIAGMTMTGLGFYWLLDLLVVFSGFPTAVCILFLLLLCAYQGGRVALLGWLCARAEQRGRDFCGVFALGFVASEVAFPLLFPWSFGAVLHGLPVALQVAELGGPIAVALPLLAVNVAIYLLLRREAGSARRAAAWLLLPLSSLAYGAWRLPEVDARVAAAEKGQIGLVQANQPLFGSRAELSAGLDRNIQLTRQLVREGPLDLVVWSETSVAQPMLESSAARQIRATISGQLGVPTLLGAVLARTGTDSRGTIWFNSALLTARNGELSGRYDKHFRLPFGEYLPLGDTFPILYDWSPNSGRFAAGDSLAPLALGTRRLATLICYEDVVPEFVRSLVRVAEPDLLVNLTNDAWFGDTTEPWIHLALAQFRAVEHRRFLVRATNSGVSAIVDPAGRVVAHTGTFVAASLRGQIAWLQGETVYGVVGNWPWWLLGLASLAAAVIRPRRNHLATCPIEAAKSDERISTLPAP